MQAYSAPPQQGQVKRLPGAAPRSSPEQRTQAHSKFFTGIRNGLWAPKHEMKMGKSVWFFGWLVGRQTTQNGSTGLVLGGKVLTWQWLASESGWPVRTLQRWGQILRSRGYIEIDREQHGFTVKIRNAKKSLHYQGNLFAGTPFVASLATSGDAESGEPRAKSGEAGAPILLMKSKDEGKGRRTRVKSTRSSIPSLAGQFQKLAEETWRLRYEGANPTWGVVQFTVLAKVANKHHELGLEGFGWVWANFLASTDRFITDRGHNPKDFWTYFDRLRRGPILLRGGKADAATRTQGNIAAVREFLRRDGALDGDLRRSLPPAG